MSVLFLPFRRATTGAIQPSPTWKIPPAFLAGLEPSSDAPGESVCLAVIFPTQGTRSIANERADVAWLVPDTLGTVNAWQVAQAGRLGCAAVFSTGSNLEVIEGLSSPAFQILNFPGTWLPLPGKIEKNYPVGLIGSGFSTVAVDSTASWRAGITEPVLQTFPVFSWQTSEEEARSPEARKLRAECKLIFLDSPLPGAFCPEFLEVVLDGCCLVTTSNPALHKLGFVDGENCLMVTPGDVVSKCAAVLDNAELLENLTSGAQTLALQIVENSGRNWLLHWWMAHLEGREFSPDGSPTQPPRLPWWKRWF